MALGKFRECGKEVSSEAKTCPDCGVAKPVKQQSALGIGCLALVVVGVIGTLVSSGGGSGNPSQPRGRDPVDMALKKVKLDFTWSTGGFGSVMFLNFTLTNNGDRAIKDFTIHCEHVGPSGTKIDENTQTIYETVKAHAKLRKTQFNMGFIHSQAAKTGCHVTGLAMAG